MRKLFAFLLSAVMALSLCACGKNAPADTPDTHAEPSVSAGKEDVPPSPEAAPVEPVPDEAGRQDAETVCFLVSCPQPRAGAGTDLLDFTVTRDSVPCEITDSGVTLPGAGDGALSQPFLFAGEKYSAFVSFRTEAGFDPAAAEVRLPDGFTLSGFDGAGDTCRVSMNFTVPASTLSIVLNEPCAGDNAMSASAEASLDGVGCRVTDVTWREREPDVSDWTGRLNLFCRGFEYTARISIIPNGVIPCITSDVMGILNSYADKKMFGIDVSSNYGEVTDCGINSTEAGYYYIVYIQFSLDDSTPVRPHEHQPVSDSRESTCVTAGYNRTYCRVCGDELSREDLPLAEHQWVPKETPGKEILICSVCGAVMEEASG